MAGPLDGVKVLEFTQIIAGPFCGMLLADMGADIIKFEPVEGESWRLTGQIIPKESRVFISLNRGKKGVAIDLRTKEAQAAVHELAKDADVVLINYRPGASARMGIDYETLSAINPRIIYCENTAFGRQGPMSQLGGYDIVVQGMTGLMAGEAKMDGDVPTYIYPAIADYATGIQMSNAVCAALYAREKTGKGQRIDITLMGTAIAIQTSQFMYMDAFDDAVTKPMMEDVKQARSELKTFQEQLDVRAKYRPTIGAGNFYYRVYQTKDGFVVVGALSDSLRRAFLKVTGMTDPRLRPDGTFDLLMESWPEVGPAYVTQAEALFKTKGTQEWIDLFSSEDIPVGPVHFLEELFDHPQTIANGLVQEFEHPLLGSYKNVGPAFQMSETRLEPKLSSPVLGADTDAVLRQAGLDDAQIADLRARGIIRAE